ncbi:MAG: PilZ domain-containing protein [Myxococcaceae bacterium]
MSDQDQDKRKEHRIPVDLWIEASRDGELYYQRASNLSVGGAFFVQTIPLPVGTRVALKFTLPGDEQEIECEGDIVSAKELGMGVQFVGMKTGDRERLDKIIDRVVAHLAKRAEAKK